MDSFDSIQNDWIVEIQSMEIYSLLKIFLSASFIFSSSTSFLESILVSSKNLAKNGRAQNFNFLPWDFLQFLLCKIVTYMYTLTHTILTSTHTHTLIQKYTYTHTLIHKQPQTPTHTLTVKNRHLSHMYTHTPIDLYTQRNTLAPSWCLSLFLTLTDKRTLELLKSPLKVL